MSELGLLIKLQEELIFFFDELIALLPDEPDLVIVRIFLKDKIPIAEVMDYITRELLPLENMVREKNDAFFINHNILFSKLDENKVNHFKRIWTSGSLDAENKNTIWMWFRSFISLAKKYNKVKSGSTGSSSTQ